MIPETNQTRKNLVFADHQIPIGRVKVYDTRFTVPSNGIVYRIYDLGKFPAVDPQLADPYYSTDSDTYSTVLYADVDTGGRSHMIFEDWETGVAPAVSGDYFATVHEGYFYARETGTYSFKIDYVGGVEFFFDTNTAHGFRTGGGRTANNIENLSAMWSDWAKTNENSDPVKGQTGTVTVSLTAGEFYKFRLKYWNKYRVLSSLVLSFSAPSMDGTDFYPFSAGNCSDYFYKASENDYFLEPSTVLSVIKMNGSRRETDAAAYSFTARMTDDQSQNRYDPETDTFGNIKKDMLVKFEMGYSSSDYGSAASSADYIVRFTGFITSDVRVDRDKYGAYAVFGCHDFKNRLINAHNLNYPNSACYLYNSYYAPDPDTDPDGYHRVRFWDRWPMKKAIKTLLLLGGIDPQLMNQKYRAVTVDGVVGDTNLDTIHTQDIRLESHDNYAANYEGYVWPSDYEPLWSFKFATDSVNDIINELSKNYGFRFSFSNEGIPQITSVSYYSFIARPISYLDSNLRYDRGASNYEYLRIPNGDSRAYEFYGRRADLIVRRSSLEGGFKIKHSSYVGGQWTTPVQIYKVYIDGEWVTSSSGIFNLHFPVRWHVRDGVYAPVSTNPCIIRPNFSSDYGLHRYTIEGVGDDILVDGVRAYTLDNFTPVRNYTTSNMIASLTVQDNIQDMINDVFVIGESVTAVRSDEDVAAHIPTQHIFYRAIDVRSQLDPTYKYYRGRQIPVIIKEPKITQQDRAQWLAESTLERYRTNALLANFSGVGDPYIEVFDPITVDDLKVKSITDDKVLWIVSFDESMSKGNYVLSNVETTPRPPIPSFIKEQSISDYISSNFPNKAVAFEDIYFSGSHTGISSDGEYGNDPYGTAPYGGSEYNYYGREFSNRVHFKPYEARENGDVAVISWTLLKRGRQYLEIWDTRTDDISFQDPYSAANSGGVNVNCTASEFESHEYTGKLLSVVYLNTEGVPDEPGNYSVTWDGIYESFSKDNSKWRNQSRYYELGGDVVLDEVAPSGANLFSMPYFDSTGGELPQEDWPNRTRKNCVFFPLMIKHVFVDEEGEETSYFFGSEQLNDTFTDFTAAFPFYIHTFQIPPRFNIDYDFVRVQASGGSYQTLDDKFIDNYFNGYTIYDSTGLDWGSSWFSHNHPRGRHGIITEVGDSTNAQSSTVNTPSHYNRSKVVNITGAEDHKFGVYLTCSRPNQRIQVVDAYLGYVVWTLYRGNLTSRDIEVRSGNTDARNISNPVDLGQAWFATVAYSGDFSTVSSAQFGGEASSDSLLPKRFYRLTEVGYRNPFSSEYGFRRFDSTYNMTSPINDLYNVYVVDLSTRPGLFSGLRIWGNPPLDDRYLFNPSWQGSFNVPIGIPFMKKWLLPAGDWITTNGVAAPFYTDQFQNTMVYYQTRKSQAGYGGTYYSPKCFSETFYNLCTRTRDVLTGYTNDSALYGNPNDYVDVAGYYRGDAQNQANIISKIYTMFAYPEYNRIYSSIRLVLHMHIRDEGGRIYRVVDGPELNLGTGWDVNTAKLNHSYSGLNTHMLAECGLSSTNPDSTYVGAYQYYDRYPTAILGRADDSEGLFAYELSDLEIDSKFYLYGQHTDFELFLPSYEFAGAANPIVSVSSYRVGPSLERTWAFTSGSILDSLRNVQYNMLPYGDTLRSKAHSYQSDSTRYDVFTTTAIYSSLFGERFFAVHDLDVGVDIADVDIDFNDYRFPLDTEGG